MKQNKNDYKYIKICYFSVLPKIDKEEYINACKFYAENPQEIPQDLLKEFSVFWKIVVIYVRFLKNIDRSIAFKTIVLNKKDEKFIEKMKILHQSIDKLTQILKMKLWQTKAFIAYILWRKENSMLDLLQKIHSYCEKQVDIKLSAQACPKGFQNFLKNRFQDILNTFIPTLKE